MLRGLCFCRFNMFKGTGVQSRVFYLLTEWESKRVIVSSLKAHISRTTAPIYIIFTPLERKFQAAYYCEHQISANLSHSRYSR